MTALMFPSARPSCGPQVTALGLALSLLPASSQADPMQFTDVTVEAGITFAHSFRSDTEEWGMMSGGCVAEDFNGDGLLDLYVVQGHAAPNLLYINDGDGTFTDEASSREADLVSDGMGAAGADFDNDGDVDICVTHEHPPHALLINDGTGHFTRDLTVVTVPHQNSVVPSITTSASWGDVDNDGRLELVVGQWRREPGSLWIYQNQGGGELVLKEFVVSAGGVGGGSVFSPRFADLNGDRLADLAVAADFAQSQVYLNTGAGLFRNTTGESGAGIDRNGMGNAIGDYDNDGDLDWFVSSIFAPDISIFLVGNRLYRNRGDGSFDDVTEEAGVIDGAWGWGSSFGDLDLDGDLDLYHVSGWAREYGSIVDLPENSTGEDRFRNQPSRLFENLGDGTFADVADAAGAGDPGQGRGSVLADFDNDGDLDIFIVNNLEVVGGGGFNEPGIPALLRNDTVTSNGWLKVTLDGRPPLHRDGIGSRVLVTTGQTTQLRELHASTNYMAQEPGRIAHFGLGSAPAAEEVRAQWVNGDATIVPNVAPNQQISLPSPTATVSSRRPRMGEPVTASGISAEPVGTPRQWLIEGQIRADPCVVSFPSPGPRELRLDIFEADGTTRLRSEILLVNVVSEGMTGLMVTGR